MAAAKVDAVIEKLSENRTAVAAVAAGGVVIAGAALLYKRQQQAVPKEGPYPVGSLPADAYDAVIVGAGPSGSTAAFYIAKQGGKVALLDKATFPRGEGGSDWRVGGNSFVHRPLPAPSRCPSWHLIARGLSGDDQRQPGALGKPE